MIKSGIDIPPGTVLFEDEPSHGIHRALLSRMFTPKKVGALEAQIQLPLPMSSIPWSAPAASISSSTLVSMCRCGRSACCSASHRMSKRKSAISSREGPWIGSESDVERQSDDVQSRGTERVRQLASGPPSNDIVTELLTVEFDDEHGVRRRLTKEELLMYVSILVAAGNETTGRLISFLGQLLADHPRPTARPRDNFSLIPNAIEEVQRYGPPALHTGRYVAHDADHYGQTVPAGSAILLLLGSANRDERRHEDPDRFDIYRKATHYSFGFGPHFCLGANLARLQARVVFEEVFKRWPEWEIDTDNAKFKVEPMLRSWETLPVRTS